MPAPAAAQAFTSMHVRAGLLVLREGQDRHEEGGSERERREGELLRGRHRQWLLEPLAGKLVAS